MTSQRKSIQSVTPSFGRNLNGKSWVPQLEGIAQLGEIGVGSCANRKPIHDFPMPLNTNFCSICRRLTTIKMSSYDTQFDPQFVGVRADLGVENGTNRNLVPIFLFDFYAHNRPILHRLATMHNAADGQTGRWQ